MAVVLVFLVAISGAFSKVYERCELARELKHVHKFPLDQIATWVCIAKHESSFNTSAVNHGSGDHGLFQISDLFWCSPPGNGFACNAACSTFEDDDIADDVSCIRRIYKEHKYLSGNGFNAWTVYPLYCKHDVSKYTDGCFENDVDSEPSTTALPDDDDDVYEFPPLPKPPKTIKTLGLSTSKPNKMKSLKLSTTYKPYKSTPKPFTPIHTTAFVKPTPSFRKSTLKPLKFVYQNTHADHKREQKFYGSDKSEYTFLWTTHGAPVLLTFPHLLYGDEEYLRSVEGLRPDAKLHETFVNLEPTSGTPLQMAKRVQFNMFIRAIDDITSIENVTNALVPIFWFEESMTLDDEYIDLLKTSLLTKLKILEIIKWILIGFGIVAVILPTALIILKN